MIPYFSNADMSIYLGDALGMSRELPTGSANCIVTSPPYFGLRDYGVNGQYGLESSPSEYVERLRALFFELRRVLAEDGTLWLNLGDSYQSMGGTKGVGPNASVGSAKRQATDRTRPKIGLPAKNLIGIPWRVAFALQDDGWILRNAIIWHKPNGMPFSGQDRLSNRYEQIFLFSKSQRYWFDLDPIREPHAVVSLARAKRKYTPYPERGQIGNPHRLTRACNPGGKNPGDVWSITTKPFPGAHFSVYPPDLPLRCILAGCKPGGTVLDPFHGSGTTGLVALRHSRKYIGIELNRDYIDLSLSSDKRLKPYINTGAA